MGFTITPRRSRRHPKVVLADLDFADDIALLSDEIAQAQELLLTVEKECKKVGLVLNAKKTKSVAYNIDDPTPLHTFDGTYLEWKDDFKAQAWRALNGMTKIWKSNMSKDLKIRFFIATIESILLYGCESWALSKAQEKSLDGTYTRMLRKALNIHWSSHIPNQQLYGDLPAVSNKIASRRLQLVGHCYRHPELSTQKLVLWEPTHGHRGRGRPITTYIDTLKRDTGAFEASEIAALMADKRLWKDLVVARLRATK